VESVSNLRGLDRSDRELELDFGPMVAAAVAVVIVRGSIGIQRRHKRAPGRLECGDHV